MSYLGIDIGTSGVKVLLIDRAGKALGEAHAKAVEPVRPHPGWSEQNPADWWDAVTKALDSLSKSHPTEMAAVRGGFLGAGMQMLGKPFTVEVLSAKIRELIEG